jgi:sugar (pentulose or hexulose) kinase
MFAYSEDAKRRLQMLTRRACTRQSCLVGGPSQNSIWPQILADVLDVMVEVAAASEATWLRAAICELTGIGVFSSLSLARTLSPNARR